MNAKCVFVLGPESSGSMLVARTLSHALGIHEYGQWDGTGWSEREGAQHRLLHRSIPYNRPPVYPDPEQLLTDAGDAEIHWVLTSRDVTLSEISRIDRFASTMEECRSDTERARDTMLWIISHRPETEWSLFSYEAFMLLGKPYVDWLYRRIGLDSDFCPALKDANRKRLLEGGRMRTKPRNVILRAVRSALRGK